MMVRSAGVLTGVSAELPELTRALEFQRRAAAVGFDWNTLPPVLAKIHEELGELEAEIAHSGGAERLRDELGDLLFAVVNLARKLGEDPTAALCSTNAKFQRRFAAVERELARKGLQPQNVGLAEMDAIWEAAKNNER